MGNTGKRPCLSCSRQKAKEAEKERQERELEILLAEYKTRGDEIIMLAQRYGRLMMTVITLLSVTAIVGNLASKGIPVSPNQPPSGKVVPDWVSYASNILFALPLLVFYLVASTMDSLHVLWLNGMRRAEIENAINLLAGKRLLVWDIAIVPEVFVGRNFIKYPFWIKPNLLQAFFLTVLMGATFYSLTTLARTSWNSHWGAVLYGVFLWGGMLFIAYQWTIFFGSVGRQFSIQIQEISRSG